MSNLEELIERLCPDGVEYKELSEVLTIRNGKDYKHFGEGNVPVYGSGGIMTYIDTAVYEKPSVLIPRKGSLDKLYFVQEPFWTVDTIFYTDINVDIVEPKYIFYYLQKEHLEKLNKAGGVPSLTQSVLNKVKLPVPPLEVQREIVRILDNFTFLTTELAAELAARQKQYEYYRDLLLTFKPNESTILNERTNELELSSAIRWMKLGDICLHSYSGATPKKSNSEYYTNGTIPWIRTQDVVFNNIYKVDAYITEKAVQETGAKWIPENCVIVAISGASAGRCAINKIKATTNQHCLNMEIDSSKALYKYVFYCLCNQEEELILKKQGARGDLNSSIILGMKIPIPPLEQQQRIVGILDRFDTLCNDITSGLPAEIEMRQKQYEYYRDKLLTFKELKKEA